MRLLRAPPDKLAHAYNSPCEADPLIAPGSRASSSGVQAQFQADLFADPPEPNDSPPRLPPGTGL